MHHFLRLNSYSLKVSSVVVIFLMMLQTVSFPAEAWSKEIDPFTIAYDCREISKYYDSMLGESIEKKRPYMWDLSLDLCDFSILKNYVGDSKDCSRLLVKMQKARITNEYAVSMLSEIVSNEKFRRTIFDEVELTPHADGIRSLTLLPVSVCKFIEYCYGVEISPKELCYFLQHDSDYILNLGKRRSFRRRKDRTRTPPLTGLGNLPSNKYKSIEISYLYTLAALFATEERLDKATICKGWAIKTAISLKDVDLLVYITVNGNNDVVKNVINKLDVFDNDFKMEFLITLLLSSKCEFVFEKLNSTIKNKIKQMINEVSGIEISNSRYMDKYTRIYLSLRLMRLYFQKYGELEYEYPLSCPHLYFPEIKPWKIYKNDWEQ